VKGGGKMTIHSITHNPEYGIKKATVTLQYEEIRDIANMLYEHTQDEQTRPEKHILHRDFFLLFELVKNGCIDGFTVEHLSVTQKKAKGKKNENQN
jgi:hypothetical protein